ncbi:MAG: efflux RND transporter periplasmic adaptor subunit [Planctomycetota bacterium]|nr:efflux RND transporter periplasmic adaptor subunit [Planctomycetota bacterium]
MHAPSRIPAPQALRSRIALVALGVLAAGCGAEARPPAAAGRLAAPVAVAPVEIGPITLRRTFSGALEASAEVAVAPRVGGQVRQLLVDIGDEVRRDQVVARIDDRELRQATLQGEAELAVARANQDEAAAAAEIAERALERIKALRTDGVASEAELDSARTQALARRSRVSVTLAQIQRAEAALEAARLRLAESVVRAEWADGDDEVRLVGQRFVDEGANVAAGSPVLSIVGLAPMVAVIFVPERDYARLRPGQAAALATDAYPGERFRATVARVAPVFSRSTRQVRVELEVANDDRRLKPGMFVTAGLDLGSEEAATVVPYAALTSRRDQRGVFVLVSSPGSTPTVRWVPVEVGIREGGRVQVIGEGITGSVVILGMELCDDGAPVNVAAVSDEARSASPNAGGSAPAGDL